MPWQPNLNKNKTKLHKFQFYARNRGIYRMYSGVYGVSEFKYVTRIF